MVAYVHVARCTGCGACVDVCPMQALHLVDGVAQVDGARCTACEACADICPQGAITMVSPPVTVEAEILPAETPRQPMRAASTHRAIRRVQPWVGAALAFVAREVVPRLATSLLDAWDRRNTSLGPAGQPSVDRLPGSRNPVVDTRSSRRGHQHRWQHGQR